MFDFSIVQSNTYCLLQPGCSIDNQLLFLQLLEKESEETILKSLEVDSVECGIYRVWRDSRLRRKVLQRYSHRWISQPCNYKLTPRFEINNNAVMFRFEMNAPTAV